MSWEGDAETELDSLVAAEPVLIRISAAKRLRDAAERSAAGSGADIVTIDHLRKAQSTRFLQQEG